MKATNPYQDSAANFIFNTARIAGDWDWSQLILDKSQQQQHLFDPLIQEYHGISATAKHTSDMDVNKIKGNVESPPVSGLDVPLLISTQVVVVRFLALATMFRLKIIC